MPRTTDRLHVGLMLALSFSTGIVDAVGYLGLDRVFTANMTGNVVILAMGLTGSGNLPVVGPLIALAGFVLGAMIAGRVLRGVPTGWGARDTSLLTAVAVLLVVAVVPTVIAGSSPYPAGIALPVTALLGTAMGMQAGTARHIAVTDVTTVVITSTLAALAFDSWLGRRTGPAVGPPALRGDPARARGAGRRGAAAALLLARPRPRGPHPRRGRAARAPGPPSDDASRPISSIPGARRPPGGRKGMRERRRHPHPGTRAGPHLPRPFARARQGEPVLRGPRVHERQGPQRGPHPARGPGPRRRGAADRAGRRAPALPHAVPAHPAHRAGARPHPGEHGDRRGRRPHHEREPERDPDLDRRLAAGRRPHHRAARSRRTPTGWSSPARIRSTATRASTST